MEYFSAEEALNKSEKKEKLEKIENHPEDLHLQENSI